MIDITPIVNAVIAIIAAVITAFLVPWIKSKTTEQQRKEIGAWVKIAVAAAEQLYEGQGRGAEKKAYVLEFLAKNGLTVDMDAIDTMIEAAVQQLNSSAGLTLE
ncbi:phage holin, LLH family [Tepidibacillus marianensis]|uniref:phage holin, LLH family n=1 Tax=Tepidibacillus marianensis TaxID=3131995 RepID=UPI0030D07C1F